MHLIFIIIAMKAIASNDYVSPAISLRSVVQSMNRTMRTCDMIYVGTSEQDVLCLLREEPTSRNIINKHGEIIIAYYPRAALWVVYQAGQVIQISRDGKPVKVKKTE